MSQTVIERSLFFMLVVAVWSLPYATFTAALPLGRNGNNNVMEAGQNDNNYYDPDLFEGDIVITTEQYKMYFEDSKSDENSELEHVSYIPVK